MRITRRKGQEIVLATTVISMWGFACVDTRPANLSYVLEWAGTVLMTAIATATVLAFISE